MKDKRKSILKFGLIYLAGFTIITFSFFKIYHWPNHDKEIISIQEEYTPYEWQIENPNINDFNTAELFKNIEKAEKISCLRSVLILKDKKLVVEKYFQGSTKDDAFNIFLMSQPFIASLIGIAVDEKIIENVNVKVIDFFPEYKNKTYVSDKSDLTIEHLLTNKAGLSGNQYERSFKSLNWIKSSLKRSKIEKTGEFYLQQQTAHLLSGIITESSGLSTLEFADKYLCSPLDIKIIDWFKSPEGIYRGSNAIYLCPRDLAAFGSLFLYQGELNGKQIISKKWINESLKEHVDIEMKINENFIISGVGYSWMIGKIHDLDVYLISDLGGQFIINIPSHNITIITTTKKWYDYQLIDDFVTNIVSTIK